MMNDTQEQPQHQPPQPPLPSMDQLDPAHRSLADALRVSFWVLKAVMVLLVIAYLFSGVVNVSQQQKAVRLRLGRIVTQNGSPVLEPGGPYFAWPYPFEQVLYIPTAPQQIQINNAFWYETSQADMGKTVTQLQQSAGQLNPLKDGFLLTGDMNIIHARWSVTYTVTSPVDYVTHIKTLDTANHLVRTAAQQGIIFAVAQSPAQQLVKLQPIDAAMIHAQAALDAIQSGIKITNLSTQKAVFPLPIRAAAQEIIDAESEKAQLVEDAQKNWDQALGSTAGQAYQPLLQLIEDYEQATDTADQTRIDDLQAKLDQALTHLTIQHGDTALPISGEVARIIYQAKTYRTQVVARVSAQAQYFQSLLPQYRKNPQIVLNRLWQDAKQQILTGDVETIYLPPGQSYLELNRDPKIKQDRERKRLADQEQASTNADQ